MLLDNLTYAAYQIDGDKGIKTQAASLGLPESANDFLVRVNPAAAAAPSPLNQYSHSAEVLFRISIRLERRGYA